MAKVYTDALGWAEADWTDTLQSSATGTGNGNSILVENKTTVGFNVTGITSATITVEGTSDNVNWSTLTVINALTGVQATFITANGFYATTPFFGLLYVRARISSYQSGTITVSATLISADTIPANTVFGQTAPLVVAWTSATAQNTVSQLTITNYATIACSFIQGSTITGGAVTFEVSNDNANWIPIEMMATNGSQTVTTYSLQANTNVGFQMNIAGFNYFRARLSTVISGTATVTLTVIANAGSTEWAQFITGQTTLVPASNNPSYGQVKMSGSAIQLPSNGLAKQVTLTAKSTNTASIEVGLSGVTTTADGTGNGYILEKGTSVVITTGNTNTIYAIGTTNDVLSFAGS